MSVRTANGGQLAHRKERFLAACAVAAALLDVTACSYSGSTPGQVEQHVDAGADGRASLSMLQFFVDTGQIASADIPPGVLQDGIVVLASDPNVVSPARGLLIRLSRYYDGPARKFSFDDEAGRITGLLHGPGPASNADAALVVAQELVDAGYQDAQSFGGATGDGLIKPGSAVSAWVSAHSGDPLIPGANVTIGQEQQRVAGFVYTPSSGDPTSAS